MNVTESDIRYTLYEMFRKARALRFGIVLSLLLCSSDAKAQTSLRESLEKLDKNDNGKLEPEEVTPLARPFLEQIMRSRHDRGRDPFRESLSLTRIMESARWYYLEKNGVNGRDVRPTGDRTVKGFGVEEGQAIVPDFGLPEIRFPYIKEDLDLAKRIMSQYDFNDDGFIDREEADKNRWTHRPPFDDDVDGDDRLSTMELTQRYARRRLLGKDTQELYQRSRRTGGTFKEEERRNPWGRRGETSYRVLSTTMMGRFDADRNGRLEGAEIEAMGLPPRFVDPDGNGQVSGEELREFIALMEAEAGSVDENIPAWFFEKDLDRDGQVALGEFSETISLATRDEFDLYDLNRDGFLTAAEVVKSAAVTGGNYVNDRAELIPAKRTIISEIDVPDDFILSDLNVEISITHTYASYLDAYLTGPDGQRVELFTAVGGSDDHFDRTIFDDQSRYPIEKGRPPFRERFRPEAISKKQPGLSVFNGKSVKGIWQLVIRASRSDRSGMLHNWSLAATPTEDLPKPQPSVEATEQRREDVTAKEQMREKYSRSDDNRKAEKKFSGKPTTDEFVKESQKAAKRLIKDFSNGFGFGN